MSNYVLFQKGDNSTISSTSIKEGQILFDTENLRLLMDASENGTIVRKTISNYSEQSDFQEELRSLKDDANLYTPKWSWSNTYGWITFMDVDPSTEYYYAQGESTAFSLAIARTTSPSTKIKSSFPVDTVSNFTTDSNTTSICLYTGNTSSCPKEIELRNLVIYIGKLDIESITEYNLKTLWSIKSIFGKVFDSLPNWINVLDIGVVPDDTTKATQNSALITLYSSGGNTLYFPHGNYYLTSGISISDSTLVGESRDAVNLIQIESGNSNFLLQGTGKLKSLSILQRTDSLRSTMSWNYEDITEITDDTITSSDIETDSFVDSSLSICFKVNETNALSETNKAPFYRDILDDVYIEGFGAGLRYGSSLVPIKIKNTSFNQCTRAIHIICPSADYGNKFTLYLTNVDFSYCYNGIYCYLSGDLNYREYKTKFKFIDVTFYRLKDYGIVNVRNGDSSEGTTIPPVAIYQFHQVSAVECMSGLIRHSNYVCGRVFGTLSSRYNHIINWMSGTRGYLFYYQSPSHLLNSYWNIQLDCLVRGYRLGFNVDDSSSLATFFEPYLCNGQNVSSTSSPACCQVQVTGAVEYEYVAPHCSTNRGV